ncbi:MAG TPA: class I SAM-dependent methyltransferase, partial [Thermoanaerobaculia bacterium]|nr:class I SAM-dependent methyltransferase [Thermoanaerobaculia bacterium]
MRVLDLATGTGVVARAEYATTHDIVGADPSIGMLRAGNHGMPKIGAAAERLPFADASFDMITIGFALRHFADLALVFNECRRVLRPGGRILILEITSPESRIGRAFLGAYMGGVVPLGVLAWTRSRRAAQLMRYYWETTRDCVRPEVILDALRTAGFADVKRHAELGIFSEYTAVGKSTPVSLP